MQNPENFFRKHTLTPGEILYIFRRDGRSVVVRADGREVLTRIPVRTLRTFLPQEEFLSIAKGVLVRRTSIVHISDAGVYTMTDGAAFQGRKRTPGAHKRLRDTLPAPAEPPADFLAACALLDEMPLPYCIIELVFDERGHGVDFVFRYCNRQMARRIGLPAADILDRSFYEILPNGDKTWFAAWADVALNGAQRTLRDAGSADGKARVIRCYQPRPGFCACVFVPEEP